MLFECQLDSGTAAPTRDSRPVPHYAGHGGRVYEPIGRHRAAAAEKLAERREAAGAGVLIVRGEVEEHVALEEGAAWVMDRDQLVVPVRGHLVQRDLSGGEA